VGCGGGGHLELAGLAHGGYAAVAFLFGLGKTKETG